MILDFIKDNLDGDAWEKWCDGCYRDRYQEQNYTKIPATYEGDAGIEGYTHNGIVYQCYCPEKDYSDEDLYKRLRKKATTDIKKLTNKNYAKKFLKLGINHIKEWHFVIPEYRDKRIIEHLENKRLEVLKVRESDPEIFYYIDPNIQLVIKTAEDFKKELIRLIRNPLVDIKLNVAVKSIKCVNWALCESKKTENIKRKLKAIMKTDETDEFKEMVDFFSTSYLKGIEIMARLQRLSGAIYEDLYELEQQYRAEVSIKSKMNPDNSVNYSLFQEILKDFEKTLSEEFECFTKASIKELKHDLISGWLADCSLQFKAGS